MKPHITFTLGLLVASGAAAGPSDCPFAELYGDIIATSLVPGSVELSWTVLEDATIFEYRVSRYDCTRPQRCSTPVATVMPTGPSPSGQTKTYTLIDVAAEGLWTYRLTVYRRVLPSCIEEVELLVPPPSCDVATLCAQLDDSFQVEDFAGGRTHLSWWSSAESAAKGFRVVRYDPRDPTSATDLTVMEATAACGEVTQRAFRTTSPAGEREYLLEPVDSDGLALCSVVR